MELSWSTFALEIVNFLILVWILKHFLYKPVMKVIAQRRAAIEQLGVEAERQLAQAKAVEAQYSDRLESWERERAQARELLQREMADERARQLEQVQQQIVDEREKAHRADEKQRREEIRTIEHHALEMGAEFAARLLRVGACEQVQDKLFELLLADVEQMDDEQQQAVFGKHNGQTSRVEVSAAFDLKEGQRRQLEEHLNAVAGRELQFSYSVDPGLQAGVLLCTEAWALRANLRDELRSFTEFTYVAR